MLGMYAFILLLKIIVVGTHFEVFKCFFSICGDNNKAFLFYIQHLLILMDFLTLIYLCIPETIRTFCALILSPNIYLFFAFSVVFFLVLSCKYQN